MELLETLQNKYRGSSEEELIAVIAKLTSELGKLQTLLFSRGRERTASEPVGMSLLFDEVEQALTEDALANQTEISPEEASEEEAPPKKDGSKTSKRKSLPPHLPRRREEIDLPESEKFCQEHKVALIKIGEEITEKLEIIPAKVEVLQRVILKYKCPCCESKFVAAKPPPDIIPKSYATPSLLAYIATAKFVDGLPLYRQERIFDRYSIDINRTSMARWMIRISDLVKPLLNLMHEDLMACPVIHIDETEVLVLAEPGKLPTSKSYMWVMARNSEHPIILFNYEPHRSKKAALNLLPGFNGTLLCDGYKVYPSLRTDIPIKIAGCMAHVRRKFWLAEKIIKKEAKQTTPILASKALAWIKKLYAIEKEIKHREPEDILRVRQARSLPLMQEFKAWLDGIEQRILPSSPTGKAVSYALGQWDFLLEFTKNPAVVLDNNYVEAHIRPFVVGRNAWMFSATPMGAHASAALYSLVETAKANGIDPHDYLTLIFKELPLSPDLESLEKLLPYEAKKHFPLKQFVASK